MIAYEKAFFATGVQLSENDTTKISNPMSNQMLIITSHGIGVLTYLKFSSYVTMHAFALPDARGFGLSYQILEAICEHPDFCNLPIRIRAKKTAKSLPFLLKLGFKPEYPITNDTPDDVGIAFEYLPLSLRNHDEPIKFSCGTSRTLRQIKNSLGIS